MNFITWKSAIVIALAVMFIASGLWVGGVIPLWGVFLAVPIVTAALIGFLFVVLIAAWMAGGSH